MRCRFLHHFVFWLLHYGKYMIKFDIRSGIAKYMYNHAHRQMKKHFLRNIMMYCHHVCIHLQEIVALVLIDETKYIGQQIESLIDVSS